MPAIPITDTEAPFGLRYHSVEIRPPAGRLRAIVRRPHYPNPDLPPLLALHGISRDAGTMAKAFAPHCARHGRVLITPRFSRRDWPRFQRIGAARPDLALLALLDHLQELGLADTRRVVLFGYSGGAQLAHRFAMLYPQRLTSLHVAAAGWYCLPDKSLAFPMGLAEAKARMTPDVPTLAHGQLHDFLRLKHRIYVGSEDRTRDPALRQNPVLDAGQGRHRLARAHRFAQVLSRAAQARGITADLDLTELPGCAHSFAQCAEAGLAWRVSHD